MVPAGNKFIQAQKMENNNKKYYYFKVEQD